MAHQITVEEAANHLPELVREVRNGRDVVLLQDRLPVARLVPLEDEDEPAIRVPALLRQWQQEHGLPTRPDGQGHTSVQELFAQWDQEDAGLTPEEAAAERHLWEDRQKKHQAVSL